MEKFAVIGHPVAHSLSPVMHTANFAALGFDGVYTKFDVAPEELAGFIRARRDEGYRGLNITIPHKIAVIDLLNHASEAVLRYGACNTVKFAPDGTLWGYNTDVAGFLESLALRNFSLSGARVAVLGAGGAGGALAAVCVHSLAREVVIAVRDSSKARPLAERLGVTARVALLPAYGGEVDLFRSCDLIINATPVGLKSGDKSVLPPDAFRPGQLVLDIIPTRQLPPTAAAAAAAGARVMGGLDFLVAQGAKSFEIWTGLKADRAAMLAAVAGERPPCKA